MTLFEFVIHVAVFIVPGLLLVGWDLINELTLHPSRWTSTDNLASL